MKIQIIYRQDEFHSIKELDSLDSLDKANDFITYLRNVKEAKIVHIYVDGIEHFLREEKITVYKIDIPPEIKNPE